MQDTLKEVAEEIKSIRIQEGLNRDASVVDFALYYASGDSLETGMMKVACDYERKHEAKPKSGEGKPQPVREAFLLKAAAYLVAATENAHESDRCKVLNTPSAAESHCQRDLAAARDEINKLKAWRQSH